MRSASPPAIATRLRRGDHQFLPAAVEILETPLSPVRAGMILTICAFVVSAVAWSWIGRVDVIAVAQGKIQPIGRTKTIQPLQTGKVLSVAVQNGSRVKAGDVLLTLDPAEALADANTLQADIEAERAEILRRKVALDLAERREFPDPPPLAFPDEINPSIQDRERQVLKRDLAELSANIGSLEAQATVRRAERERLVGTVAAQQTLVDTLYERVRMRETLAADKTDSRAHVIDALEALQTQQTTLASEQGQLGQTDAELDRVDREMQRGFATFASDNARKLADAERLLDENSQKLSKAQLRASEMTLHSPIDGIVSGLAVTSVGQVLNVGEQAMQIVPESADIEIEAYLPNADVGFVHPDQEAIVKVEAFPFTDYGSINARVVRVARDAIPQIEADMREQNPAAAMRSQAFGGAQRLQNLVYPVTLALERSTMALDGGPVALVPGMAVTVEVKTGTRRILSYLFSPLLQVGTTALRER